MRLLSLYRVPPISGNCHWRQGFKLKPNPKPLNRKPPEGFRAFLDQTAGCLGGFIAGLTGPHRTGEKLSPRSAQVLFPI